MPKKLTEQEIQAEMLRLTPDQFQELGRRIAPLNQILREENAKPIPNYDVMLEALEGIYQLSQDLNLTPNFDIEKVRAEYHIRTSAPKTLQ